MVRAFSPAALCLCCRTGRARSTLTIKALGRMHFAGRVAPVFGQPREIGRGHVISERGFTYIYVLFLIALIGVQLALVGTIWHTKVKREKEAELLFIGHEFRRAIASFHTRTPGSEKRYPRSLEDLLLDPRFPQTVRHLRRIYRDPMTGKYDWGLQHNENGDIVGMYSLSTEKPMKIGGFRREDEAFTGMVRYDQWVFTPMGALAETGGIDEANASTGKSEGGT